MIGALFCWGNGWLFSETELSVFLIPMADLIWTGPLSLAAAFGLWSKKRWGLYLGLVTSGTYILGSILVLITLFWEGRPFALEILVPAITGLSIAVSFLIWVIKPFQKKGSDEFE